MTDKKTKEIQAKKNVCYGLIITWVLSVFFANLLGLEKFVNVNTSESFISEKTTLTLVKNRVNWVLIPDKTKNITPRFFCGYFIDDFCGKMPNYQSASDVHYLQFDGGSEYSGKMAGDFNAILLNGTIYTKDNQAITYQLPPNELAKYLNRLQKEKFRYWLIYSAVFFILLYFPIIFLLTAKNHKEQTVNST